VTFGAAEDHPGVPVHPHVASTVPPAARPSFRFMGSGVQPAAIAAAVRPGTTRDLNHD